MDAQTLAKALWNIAIPLLMLVGIAHGSPGMELTGVDFSTTSGTLNIQRTSAKSTVFSPNGRWIIAQELELYLRVADNNTVFATAEEALIVLNGDNPDRSKKPLLTNFNLAGVLQIGQNFEKDNRVGDILLRGKDRRATAELGDDGLLESDVLIWSEERECYILPGEFEQTIRPEDGTSIRITGEGAVINADFNQFKYFGTEENPARMVFVAPENVVSSSTTSKAGN